MCNNTFNSNYLPKVSRPFSILKYPFQYYHRLIEEFFSFMYEGIDFRIIPYREGYEVLILDVNPSELYHPSTFDPSYIVRAGEDIKYIKQFEFFETFYSYIPDIVPYLKFKLIAPRDYYSSVFNVDHNGCFKEFDLNEFYHREESVRRYQRNEYNIENRQINSTVRYDEFDWG
jgi:hypothetical protein